MIANRCEDQLFQTLPPHRWIVGVHGTITPLANSVVKDASVVRVAYECGLDSTRAVSVLFRIPKPVQCLCTLIFEVRRRHLFLNRENSRSFCFDHSFDLFRCHCHFNLTQHFGNQGKVPIIHQHSPGEHRFPDAHLILKNECEGGEPMNDEDDEIKRMPIKDLVSEDGAHELATSPEMAPYLRLIKAGMQDHDTAPHLEAIRQLPLEKRYVWRVASALKWAFADFDDVNVNVDRETLSEEDLKKLVELLRFRPIQMCMFLKALLGTEMMEMLIEQGVALAKREE